MNKYFIVTTNHNNMAYCSGCIIFIIMVKGKNELIFVCIILCIMLVLQYNF